jgi:SET domain-containing protein
MISIAQIAILITLLPTLSTAYTASYVEQINAFAKTNHHQVQKSNNAKASSDRRPTLSNKCLAHVSADIADIDIHKASEVKGLGAFSTAPIKFGTFLGEYKGESMTLSEVNARFWNKREPDVADKAWAESRMMRNQAISGDYIFDLYDGFFVCAEDSDQSTWTRFMNHASGGDNSCNVRPFTQTDLDGETHIYPRFFAIRDIEEGEELQYDYGPDFFK